MKKLCFAAVIAACAGVGLVSAATAHVSRSRAATPAGQTFWPGSEQTFSVPRSGVIHVVATGGTGGENADNDGFGGYGSVVTADIKVKKGTLYVDVGSNGANDASGGLSGTQASGGIGGSHFSSQAGGGGGASVVSTCSANVRTCRGQYFRPVEPRLIVAGGGGGAGGIDGCDGGNGGGGLPAPADWGGCANGGGGGNGVGANGQDVLDYPSATYVAAGGGKGATPWAPGAGGSSVNGAPGAPGSHQFGGNGYTVNQSDTDGGGGGGYYGGGGGTCFNSCDNFGAGAGAGSSFTKGFNVSYDNDTTATPSVTITFTPS